MRVNRSNVSHPVSKSDKPTVQFRETPTNGSQDKRTNEFKKKKKEELINTVMFYVLFHKSFVLLNNNKHGSNFMVEKKNIDRIHVWFRWKIQKAIWIFFFSFEYQAHK